MARPSERIIMFAKLKLMFMLLAVLYPQPTNDIYSVWAEPGLHLMMCDNGTPEDFSDDWVVDWEDNRMVSVYVFD